MISARAVWIETAESAVRASLGHRGEEARVAVTDFVHRGLLRHHRKQAGNGFRDEPRPSHAVVKHQVWLFTIWNLAVPEVRIEDVAAFDAANEIDWWSLHRARGLRTLRPSERSERLHATVAPTLRLVTALNNGDHAGVSAVLPQLETALQTLSMARGS